MDVPSECTIVRTVGQVGVGSGKQAAIGGKHTQSMSVVLSRSGQHCNERSIFLELNETHRLRLLLVVS